MPYIQCVNIVKATYQISLSKAVVGVDLSMKAHYLCIYKSHFRGNVKVLVAVISSKFMFLHAYVQCVYNMKAKYQMTPSKTVVGVDRPMQALSMHIQKPY